jgi:hypothetical protein
VFGRTRLAYRAGPGAQVATGSCAEYASVAQGLLVRKPENLTFEQAAAVPLAALTALQALRDAGRLQPGQKVLINGASGGVGTFAVQIAKSVGAEVTGVCSTKNLDLVRSIGADVVIDYTRDDFTSSGQRYDLILDTANRSLADCRRALTPKGIFVPIGGAGRPLDRPAGPPIPGAPAVPAGEPDAAQVPHHLEPAGPATPQGPHRIRHDHARHRPHLPAERDPRGDAIPRSRPRPREDHHRRVTMTGLSSGSAGRHGA